MSRLKGSISRLLQWWKRIQPMIDEAGRRNIAEHRYWAMRRAENEWRSLGCGFTSEDKRQPSCRKLQ